MSIQVKQLAYCHADREPLFKEISFTVGKKEKVALIGNNGTGKSTLLRLLAGKLSSTSGEIAVSGTVYYVPQHFGQFTHHTVADALGVAEKQKALQAILAGDASVENFTLLNDDWNIEERTNEALTEWGIEYLLPSQPFDELSGGEKTLVFLAGITVHEPDIVLLDEPTNHLDVTHREQLYRFIASSNSAFLIVSHDRNLLNQLPVTLELTPTAMKVYGGNYSFYQEQAELEREVIREKIRTKEKELKTARKIARETVEQKQKNDVRGKKIAEKKGIPRIMMGAMRQRAENSSSHLKEVHEEKIGQLSGGLSELRSSIPDMSQMKVDFNASSLHRGKLLFNAENINFSFQPEELLWKQPLTFRIDSGERIAIEGDNGSGKTTLLRLLLGELTPNQGSLLRAEGIEYVYMDQEYSLIQPDLTVYEQLEKMNKRQLPEPELKTILHRFLFPHPVWNKKCATLSGGEKMRLSLCCLMVSQQSPDIFILDEPTNNLDILNLNILTGVIRDYQGTVLIISHDSTFLKEIGINRRIRL